MNRADRSAEELSAGPSPPAGPGLKQGPLKASHMYAVLHTYTLLLPKLLNSSPHLPHIQQHLRICTA